MNKIAGRLSVSIPSKIERRSQITIIKRYNPFTTASIRLDGLEDIEDLIYLLQGLKTEIIRREQNGI